MLRRYEDEQHHRAGPADDGRRQYDEADLKNGRRHYDEEVRGRFNNEGPIAGGREEYHRYPEEGRYNDHRSGDDDRRYHSHNYERRRYRSRSRSRSHSPRRYHDEYDSCRVFVGNLSFDTDSHDLKDLMRKMGPVVECELKRSVDGVSKGCALVEFKYPEDARAAIREYSDYRFMGRQIYVRVDRENGRRRRSPPRRSRPDRDFGVAVFVGNLPFSVSWQDLKDIFRKSGGVTRSDVLMNSEHRSKGCGVVHFETMEDAERAIKMFDNTEVQGRMIEVRFDKYSKPSSRSRDESVERGRDRGRYGDRHERDTSVHGFDRPYSRSQSRERRPAGDFHDDIPSVKLDPEVIKEEENDLNPLQPTFSNEEQWI